MASAENTTTLGTYPEINPEAYAAEMQQAQQQNATISSPSYLDPAGIDNSDVYGVEVPNTDTGTERTVISSEPAREAVADMQNQLEEETQKLQQPDDGRTPGALVVGKDIESEAQKKARLEAETKPLSEAERQIQEFNQAAQNELKQLEELRVSINAANQAQYDALKRKLELRVGQMEEVNRRALETQRILGITSGRQRYAPVHQAGIMSAEERAGIQRLQELEAENASLLAQAQAANQAEDWNRLNKIMEERGKIRDRQREELQNQIALAAQEEMRVQELNRQISLEGSVASLISQGVTSPLDMIELLNYDDAGNQIADVTLEEISDIMDIVQSDEADYTGTLKEFYDAQRAGLIPEEMGYFDFIAAKGAAGRAPNGYSSEPVSMLDIQRAQDLWGFIPAPGSTLDDIQNQYMTDRFITKSLITESFTRDSLKSVAKSVEKIYTPELKLLKNQADATGQDYETLKQEFLRDKEDFAGALRRGKKEAELFVEEKLMGDIEKLRSVGYSDYDILDYISNEYELVAEKKEDK